MSVPLAYSGVILIWSTTPLAIKWSSDGSGFLFGISSRMLMATLLCLVLIRLLKIELPWHRDAFKTYLAAGMGFYAAMLAVYWGAQFIPSGMVSVLFGLTPLFTGILAAIWLGNEKFGMEKIIGTLAGLFGLMIIFSDNIEVSLITAQGIIAVLISVILHSISSIHIKRIDAGLPSLAITTGGLLIAAPLFIATWLISGQSFPEQLTLRSGISIVYLSVFGSVIGFIMYFYTLKNMDASKVALITLITPVIALIIGTYFNHEEISHHAYLGTAVILTGLISFQWVALSRVGRKRLIKERDNAN